MQGQMARGSKRRSPLSKIACVECQRKRIKCGGRRPTCVRCEERSLECEYDVEEGLTRRQQLQRNQDKFKGDSLALKSLYSYLHSAADEDVASLVQQIRGGVSLEKAVEIVGNNGGTSATPSIGPDNESIPSPAQDQTDSDIEDSQILDPPLLPPPLSRTRSPVDQHFSLTNTSGTGQNPDSASGGAHQIPHIDKSQMRTLFETGNARYLECTGTMFAILNKTELDYLMKICFEETPQTSESERTLACAELYAIAALGLRYASRLQQEGGLPSHASLYFIARTSLDMAVGRHTIRAARISVILSLYHLLEKSTLAILYADWAVLLSDSRVAHHRAEMDPLFACRPSKVHRIAVAVRCWLTATLGNVPAPCLTSLIFSPSICLVTDEDDALDMLQFETAKIIIVKAKIFRLGIVPVASWSDALSRMKGELTLWYDQLPKWMHLNRLTDENDFNLTPEQRQATLSMHLFYFSAVVLKARALLAKRDAPEVTSVRSEECRRAVLDGLDAARLSARLFGLMRDENTIVKHCWLPVYQAYASFLMLSLSTAMGLVDDDPARLWQNDVQLTRNCHDVLETCGEADSVAQSLVKRLSNITTGLETERARLRANPRIPHPLRSLAGQDQHLFSLREGSQWLRGLIQDILTLLCSPFGQSNLDNSDESATPSSASLMSFGGSGETVSMRSGINTVGSQFGEQENTVVVTWHSNLDGYEDKGVLASGYISGTNPYNWIDEMS